MLGRCASAMATAGRRLHLPSSSTSTVALQRGLATASVKKNEIVPLTAQQKVQLMCSSGVGMVGFGFIDNFVMIVAGDAIDANLGATLGLSAIAAAGIGNTMSDVTGHYFGDAIDRFAGLLGLEGPTLTDEQKESKTAESCRRHGGAIGLALGCLLGMCPLLWTGILKRKKMTEEEQQLYSSVFQPLGVTAEGFLTPLLAAEWKTAQNGAKIIAAGQPADKVVLLSSGVTHAINDGEDVAAYAAKAAHNALGPLQDRGCFIGLSRLCKRVLDENEELKPFPDDIIAAGVVRYVEWDLNKLAVMIDKLECEEMAKAMFNILTKELKMRAKKGDKKESTSALHDYKIIVKAVLADGVVTQGEQEFTRSYAKKHGISKEEQIATLKENGWTAEDWEKGHWDHDFSSVLSSAPHHV